MTKLALGQFLQRASLILSMLKCLKAEVDVSVVSFDAARYQNADNNYITFDAGVDFNSTSLSACLR